jgi:hypothetical protein
MKGSRPDQAELTRDTDMSKTDDTRAVIEGMVDGLNDHRIGDIDEFFSENFRWMGNQGCGQKTGLREFQDNWQRPFQAAFSDKGLHRRSTALYGRMGRCLWPARRRRIPVIFSA